METLVACIDIEYWKAVKGLLCNQLYDEDYGVNFAPPPAPMSVEYKISFFFRVVWSREKEFIDTFSSPSATFISVCQKIIGEKV